MKILKWLLVLLGVAGGVGAGVYAFRGWLELRNLVAVAESMRSAPQINPQQELALAIGLAALGGLLLGLGLAMPRRTAAGIRKETLESVADAKEADIRRRATGYASPADRTTDPLTDEKDLGGNDGQSG